MRRACALIVAVLACSVQAGDADLPAVSVRAMLCEPEGRDPCGKRRAKVLQEPSRIRVEVYLAQHPQNRDVIYGIACAGEQEPRAVSGPYSLEVTPPLMFAEYGRQLAGECYGFAILVRRDGDTLRARDGPLRILARN